MIKKILPLVGALMLAGCVNLAPEYERPEAPVAQAWPTGEAYEAAQLKAEQLPSWNEFFVNESLKEVIRLGLENNRSLLAVAHTVEQMRAQYRVQRSELFPTVAAAAQNAVTNTSRMTQAQGLDITSHNYTAQLAMASYEIDFFGRIRNLNERALQAYLASEDAHRSARSTLIAEIAMMWLQLGADRMQLALQQETLKSQEESFRLIEESYKIGSVSRLDYEQARSTVATARASIASYVRAVAQDRNALELLVGTKIDDSLLPEKLDIDATLVPTLPPGLPGEVLLNRPDIQQAERELIAANAAIGAARAAFFPNVSITAGAGSNVLHLSDLFESGSGMWTFTPSVNIPIFTGGLNLANLEAAEAGQKIAVANYESAIQSAFREVADALSTEGTIENELKAREDLADASTQAYGLADSRYRHGAATYLEVLDAQRSMVSARQALISTQLSRAASRVTFFKVLGGGAELPATEETTKQANG